MKSSVNGVRVVPGATHQSLVWKSADAQVTIDSIRQALDAARTEQPMVARSKQLMEVKPDHGRLAARPLRISPRP
jgi:hypothetical protein